MKSLYNGFEFLPSSSAFLPVDGDIDYWGQKVPEITAIYSGTSNLKRVILIDIPTKKHICIIAKYSISPRSSTGNLDFTPYIEYQTIWLDGLGTSPTNAIVINSDRFIEGANTNLIIPSAPYSDYKPELLNSNAIIRIYYKTSLDPLVYPGESILTIIRGTYYLL